MSQETKFSNYNKPPVAPVVERTPGFGKFMKPAGIIATIFFSIYTLVSVILSTMSVINPEVQNSLDIMFTKIFQFLFQDLLGPVTIGFLAFGLGVMVCVFLIVFSCKLITISNKDAVGMYNKKVNLIVYCAYFLIWNIVPIIALLNRVIPVFIVAIIINLIIILLTVIDIIRVFTYIKKNNIDTKAIVSAEKQAKINTTLNKIVDTAKKVETDTSAKPAPVEAKEGTPSKLDKIEKELVRLNELKQKGLITEEEFSSLKQNLFK